MFWHKGSITQKMLAKTNSLFMRLKGARQKATGAYKIPFQIEAKLIFLILQDFKNKWV